MGGTKGVPASRGGGGDDRWGDKGVERVLTDRGDNDSLDEAAVDATATHRLAMYLVQQPRRSHQWFRNDGIGQRIGHVSRWHCNQKGQ